MKLTKAQRLEKVLEVLSKYNQVQALKADIITELEATQGLGATTISLVDSFLTNQSSGRVSFLWKFYKEQVEEITELLNGAKPKVDFDARSSKMAAQVPLGTKVYHLMEGEIREGIIRSAELFDWRNSDAKVYNVVFPSAEEDTFTDLLEEEIFLTPQKLAESLLKKIQTV